LRDQLDTYWQRALAGYAEAAEAPDEEGNDIPGGSGCLPGERKGLEGVPGGSAHRRGAPGSGRAGEPDRPHARRRVSEETPGLLAARAAVPGRGRRRMEPAPPSAPGTECDAARL